MTPTLANRRDLIAASALLVTALVWIALVYSMIEPGQGPQAGPRAFPMFFGIVLALLSAGMLARALLAAPEPADPDEEVLPPVSRGGEAWAVGGTIVLTLALAFLFERVGFIVASAVFVAAVVVLLLRITRPVFVLSMSLGMSLGAYLIFGKALGTYLPSGTWISVWF